MDRRKSFRGWRVLMLSMSIALASNAMSPAHAFAADEDRWGWITQFGDNLLVGSNAPMLDVSEAPGAIRGLSVSGFFDDTTGMWADSSALRGFGRSSGEHHNSNSLAVERNWVQVDSNYVLDGNNKFFLRFWGVYEPSYRWEEGDLLSPENQYNRSKPDFYNRYDVRDAFWKNTSGPLTTFIGRQIVTWGESLSFRVGDVINPQDVSWNFGFANLEQSRLPLWMLHPILNLPDCQPFQSSFIEGVWAPEWQPLYTSVDYPDDRYSGQHSVAGAVNLEAPGGGRFDTYPYPFTIPVITPPGRQAAFPQITGAFVPRNTYRLPPDNLADSMGGFRLHTIVDDAEVTMLYWHGHQFNDTTYVVGHPGGVQTFQSRYPQLNDVGVTANRPIYLPGARLSQLPFVVRAEGVWQDRAPFNTIDVTHPSAVIYSSTVNTLLALDLDNLAAPWLTRTGTITTNFEWNNFSILSPSRGMVYGGYAERWRHNEENLLLSGNTSWWWGAVVANPAAIYNPDGNTWEFFPSVTITPPWTDKYFTTLQYVGVVSNDKNSAFAGGNFRGKNILLVQFQYNFDLMRGRQ
jgi:hypothetical protein